MARLFALAVEALDRADLGEGFVGGGHGVGDAVLHADAGAAQSTAKDERGSDDHRYDGGRYDSRRYDSRYDRYHYWDGRRWRDHDRDHDDDD